MEAEELETFFDGLMPAQMNAFHVPGAAISIVQDGRLLFAKGDGYADVALRKPVVTESTALEMQRQSFTNDPRLSGYAHGFSEATINEQHVIGHTGDILYFHNGLFLLPEQSRIATMWQGLLGLLALLLLIGFVSVFSNPETVFGISPWAHYLFLLPLPIAILAVGMIGFTILAWTRRWWSLPGRVHYTLAGLTFTWWMVYWNLWIGYLR